MKFTKAQLKRIIKEEIKQLTQEEIGTPGQTPTVDELASGYWNAALQGRSNFLVADLKAVWNPLAKGQEADPSALSSTTEFVSGMERSDLRHYARNVQNALMNLLKDILRDEAPPEMAKRIGPGEKKLAQKLLQKLFGEVDVNPAYRAQIPGMQEGNIKLTKSQLKRIIKEEIATLLEDQEYIRTGAPGPLQPPFDTEEVNGIKVAPITNAGQKPHDNPEWMQKFADVKDDLKKRIESGQFAEYSEIYIEPSWGRGKFGNLFAKTADGNSKKIRLADWASTEAS